MVPSDCNNTSFVRQSNIFNFIILDFDLILCKGWMGGKYMYFMVNISFAFMVLGKNW